MKKIKTILTTDMEVDDRNSLIHLCLYLNEIDLRGVIYTSSQYHFNGDGIHTLGEITPNYRCSGLAGLERPRKIQGTDPSAKDLKVFRPFPLGWIENLWQKEYAEAYPYLLQQDPSFPSPEYLLSITKVGNIEFEGDVRFETEGSKLIKEAILSIDDEPLYLQSWGGVNTIVRALLSIYEEYGNTEKWEDIYQRVIHKVRIFGVTDRIGQDNSYLDARIPELYPDLVLLSSEFVYGTYNYFRFIPKDLHPLFSADAMKKYIHEGNGSLMEAYHLMGDGKRVEGEAEIYQFGITSALDFGKTGVPVFYFEPYTFLAEGDSNTYIPLFSFGLRGLERTYGETLLGRIRKDGEAFAYPRKENPYLKAYQEDFFARARWCSHPYAEVNHAPRVHVKQEEFCACIGEKLKLEVEISDPDGRSSSKEWHVYDEEGREVVGCVSEDSFTLPEGNTSVYNLVCSVRNEHETPMSSFAQIIVHVRND